MRKTKYPIEVVVEKETPDNWGVRFNDPDSALFASSYIRTPPQGCSKEDAMTAFLAIAEDCEGVDDITLTAVAQRTVNWLKHGQFSELKMGVHTECVSNYVEDDNGELLAYSTWLDYGDYTASDDLPVAFAEFIEAITDKVTRVYFHIALAHAYTRPSYYKVQQLGEIIGLRGLHLYDAPMHIVSADDNTTEMRIMSLQPININVAFDRKMAAISGLLPHSLFIHERTFDADKLDAKKFGTHF